MKTNQKKFNNQEKDNEEEDYLSAISMSDNHIWFYNDINSQTASILCKILYEASKKFTMSAFSSNETKNPIYLHINSIGGDLFSSFAIFDTIEKITQTIPVITIVEGCAASGATFISLAGSKRLIRKNGFMLIHELRDISGGAYGELVDNMNSNKSIMENVKKIYLSKTKISKKEIDQILSRDLWWNADKCLEHGLVDGII